MTLSSNHKKSVSGAETLLLLLVLSLAAVVPSASGQQHHRRLFDGFYQLVANGMNPAFEVNLGGQQQQLRSVDTGILDEGDDAENQHRELQTSGGTVPDLIGLTSDCNTVGGTQFECDMHQRIGTLDDYMDMNFTVGCLFDVTTGFDFRRVGGCYCSVLLTPSNTSRLPKTCPCFTCPRGFGASSVSIDCTNLIPTEPPTVSPAPEDEETAAPSSSVPIAASGERNLQSSEAPCVPDPFQGIECPEEATATNGTSTAAPSMAPTSQVPDPYIFATCTSVDCGGNCNGTCSLGCDEAGFACEFCEASPTAAPTGVGADVIDDIGQPPSSPALPPTDGEASAAAGASMPSGGAFLVSTLLACFTGLRFLFA